STSIFRSTSPYANSSPQPRSPGTIARAAGRVAVDPKPKKAARGGRRGVRLINWPRAFGQAPVVLPANQSRPVSISEPIAAIDTVTLTGAFRRRGDSINQETTVRSVVFMFLTLFAAAAVIFLGYQ